MVIFHSYVKLPEGVYGDGSKHVKTCQKPVPLVNKKNNWDIWMLIPPNNGQTMINMILTHPWEFPDMGVYLQIIHFILGCSFRHHLAIGYPHLWKPLETPVYSHIIRNMIDPSLYNVNPGLINHGLLIRGVLPQ
jgi:hypothetical protein